MQIGMIDKSETEWDKCKCPFDSPSEGITNPDPRCPIHGIRAGSCDDDANREDE